MIKENQKFLNGVLVFLDILVLLLSFGLAWYLKFYSGFLTFEEHLHFYKYAQTLIFVIPIFVILQYIYELYTPQRAKYLYSEILNIIKSCLTLLLLMMSVLFIIKQIHISREFILIFTIGNIALLTLERSIIRLILRAVRGYGYNLKYVLVIGSGEMAIKYLKAIERNKSLGYKAVGVLDDEKKKGYRIANTVVLDNIESLSGWLEQQYIDEVIIALSLNKYDKLKNILNICEKAGIKTLIIPAYLNYVSAKPHFDEIENIPLINTRYIPLDNMGNRIIKRLFDFTLVLISLVVFLPIMAVCCVLVAISSPGPVIFKQERIGYNKKPFIIYKFRTMRCQTDDQSEKTWTVKSDRRKTKVGEFLRKTSLDELPQLFNVLKGDMSIIGPRPERSYFVERFKEEIPKYMIKHHVKPGLTGWAQVNGWRGDTSIKERIKHDIYYIENWSFAFDIRILWLTVIKGFINRNAY